MLLDLECRAFNPPDFEEVVRQAAKMAPHAAMPDQVRYLSYYLSHEEMGARSMLIERPYIDRHYLTEYQGYYATSLQEIPRHTTRVHFFSRGTDITTAKERLIEAADADARRAIRHELQDAYLGFVVLRPLPTAPVGRTVLRWYGGRNARCFGPHPPPYRAHILGLTLKAHGVPFHQQDQAVGACATAAIWSALSAVMRRDGGRSLTPIHVTELAIRSLPTSRALPAVAGLTLEQMVGAINASGYSPDVFKSDGNLALFQLQLMTYVRSGIPLILQVREDGVAEGHAVTVVGFRVSDDEHNVPPIEHHISDSHSLRAKGMTRVYVNDDRLGPYTRMEWLTAPEDAEPDFPTLQLNPHTRGFENFCTPMQIWTAIAPMCPKIRINALDLFSVATEVWPTISFLAGADKAELLLESFFALGGNYAEGIYELGMPSAWVVDVISSLLLSRYIGVLRFRIGEQWFLDVVCDTTDIHRKEPPWKAVLAILCSDSTQAERLRPLVGPRCPHVVVK